MNRIFIDFLQQNGFLPERARLLSQKSEFLNLPAKIILAHQGDSVEHLYFIIEGLCHAYYLTSDGKKFSKEFFWSKDCIVNFESLIGKSSAPYSIETLAPCQLIKMPINELQQWREQCHPFYLKLLENQLLHKENKERFMLLNSPEERYILFSERFPDLHSRISDYQIASYIGITPISLSRIKKRLGS
ncbi:Crp/Fnr family transcriptional regulator [Colwellia psychrerythraea]|uniref:Putative transcriptional regulator, Crp/Fnr family n=1 Tax=Colwellia psychrerythraea TaxID=28229 RepID=A0A099KRU6_COLPS|nr:Crp/Fnr family transcriptional regulator [Colwellia psychrerythraea]KGJ92582.1 putative transcriptional regulator, Crp/Fnr family [Colwellia psychrerythraea]